ncbi:MAG TPA: DinB family protein [Candidatus Binatia bacterium]|nr:DinB family protein [Candidatus Binatia bacterium]
MKAEFEMLAAYNTWVNGRLYDAAARVPDAEYRRDRGAFFGSLHGTLNHLLLGDLIWMHRFTGEGDEPGKLDDILHDDLASLRAARAVEDARIEAYVRRLTPAALAGTITYRTTRNPTDIEQELAPLLIHFFNHQTHHRGQAHGLLTAIGGEAPSFDLLVFQRQTGISIRKGAGGTFSSTEKRPPQ